MQHLLVRLGHRTKPLRPPASPTVTAGQELALHVSVRNANGSQIATPAELALASRNPAVMSVEAGQRVRARAAGFAWIVGTLQSGGRLIADSVNFTVTCPAVLVISIRPDSVTMNVGEKFTPTVELFGCGGSERITDTFAFNAFYPTNSNVTGVIAVDSTTGETVALKSGFAWTVARSARFGQLGAIPVTVR